jgi:hypothetical protein
MVPKAKPPDLVLAGAGIVPKPKPPRAGAALAAAPASKPKGWRGPSSESETSQRETSQRPTRASGDSGDSGDSGSSPPHKGDASQRSTQRSTQGSGDASQRSTQRSGDASQRSFRARDPFAGDALQDSALLAHPLAHRGRGRQPVRTQLALLHEERSRALEAAPEADGCSRQTSSRGSGSHRSTWSRARKARRNTRDQLSGQSLDSKLFTLPEEGEMEDM